MKLFIIRHGETDINKEKRYQGINIDISLNKEGIEQVKNTLKYFQKKQIKTQKIYTSPLKRTTETSSILNTYFQADIIEDKLLLIRYCYELTNPY